MSKKNLKLFLNIYIFNKNSILIQINKTVLQFEKKYYR